MELGQRIRQARLEAGLSQRQLCGEQLTRNMLSQIENGSARPSMKTLQFLAQQLGKPMAYFLEEQAAVSPNSQCIADARIALALGDLEKMRRALDGFTLPDAMLFEERQLLEYLWHLRRAEQALNQQALPYAGKLLRHCEGLEGLYITQELRYKCRVLLALAGDPQPLDCDEQAILARAQQASAPQRRLEILSAAEDRTSPQWNLLQAEAMFQLERYQEAAEHFRLAEQTQKVYARLEACYRELGDYKQAYEYACLQR